MNTDSGAASVSIGVYPWLDVAQAVAKRGWPFQFFSEAVPLLKRQSLQAKAFCQRIENKHGSPRANSLLAVKLGRAVYFMLRRGDVFDISRMIR